MKQANLMLSETSFISLEKNSSFLIGTEKEKEQKSLSFLYKFIKHFKAEGEKFDIILCNDEVEEKLNGLTYSGKDLFAIKSLLNTPGLLENTTVYSDFFKSILADDIFNESFLSRFSFKRAGVFKLLNSKETLSQFADLKESSTTKIFFLQMNKDNEEELLKKLSKILTRLKYLNCFVIVSTSNLKEISEKEKNFSSYLEIKESNGSLFSNLEISLMNSNLEEKATLFLNNDIDSRKDKEKITFKSSVSMMSEKEIKLRQFIEEKIEKEGLKISISKVVEMPRFTTIVFDLKMGYGNEKALKDRIGKLFENTIYDSIVFLGEVNGRMSFTLTISKHFDNSDYKAITDSIKTLNAFGKTNFKNFLEDKELYEKVKNNKGKVLVGYSALNEPLFLNVFNSSSILAIGEAKSGKTASIINIIENLKLNNTSKELQFLLFDNKGGIELADAYKDSEYFRDFEHFVLESSEDNSYEEAEAYLGFLKILIEERLGLFSKAGAKGIDEYNEKVSEDKKKKRIVVVIDELGEISLKRESFTTNLADAISLSSFAGIHFLVSAQNTSERVISKKLDLLCSKKLFFHHSSFRACKEAAGIEEMNKLLSIGDGIFKQDLYSTRFQGMFVSDEMIKHNIQNEVKEVANSFISKEEILKLGRNHNSRVLGSEEKASILETKEEISEINLIRESKEAEKVFEENEKLVSAFYEDNSTLKGILELSRESFFNKLDYIGVSVCKKGVIHGRILNSFIKLVSLYFGIKMHVSERMLETILSNKDIWSNGDVSLRFLLKRFVERVIESDNPVYQHNIHGQNIENYYFAKELNQFIFKLTGNKSLIYEDGNLTICLNCSDFEGALTQEQRKNFSFGILTGSDENNYFNCFIENGVLKLFKLKGTFSSCKYESLKIKLYDEELRVANREDIVTLDLFGKEMNFSKNSLEEIREFVSF